MLLTAAHCIEGSTKGFQNPSRDFAFLTVAPRRIGGAQTDIQTVTGANVLSTRPSRGEAVTVPAYPAGEADDPITCTAKVYFEGTFPAFNCNPYVDGTSGSPWLAPTPEGVLVVGLIAGLHQGGCYPYTSYSPPLDGHTRAVYQRAITGAKPDIGPEPGSDDCSTGL